MHESRTARCIPARSWLAGSFATSLRRGALASRRTTGQQASALAIVAFLAMMLPQGALGTTLQHLDTRALSHQSSDIVVGQVEAVHSRWNDARTRIVTDVTVRVSESLKGAATSRLVLTQLGGEVEGIRVSVPGCPVFRAGEEALVFVWRDREGTAQVTGLAQGKFEIERDAVSGERYVQRALPGFAVKDLAKLGAAPPGARAPRLRLGDLISEIRRETGVRHDAGAR